MTSRIRSRGSSRGTPARSGSPCEASPCRIEAIRSSTIFTGSRQTRFLRSWGRSCRRERPPGKPQSPHPAGWGAETGQADIIESPVATRSSARTCVSSSDSYVEPQSDRCQQLHPSCGGIRAATGGKTQVESPQSEQTNLCIPGGAANPLRRSPTQTLSGRVQQQRIAAVARSRGLRPRPPRPRPCPLLRACVHRR